MLLHATVTIPVVTPTRIGAFGKPSTATMEGRPFNELGEDDGLALGALLGANAIAPLGATLRIKMGDRLV